MKAVSCPQWKGVALASTRLPPEATLVGAALSNRLRAVLLERGLVPSQGKRKPNSSWPW